ncbi:DUF1569 domain-containing protein [Streptomyces sp. NPDC059104]|uniref:DUF1569 domain-containing protein n=1 Tax=Streptomyces sp. NPDC059104 TaxID=3346729 RepID=UPI0036D17764
MTGCPRLRPAVFRLTAGRLAKGVFLRRGVMRHPLDAGIDAAYGPCTRGEYAALHAMHLVDHLPGLRACRACRACGDLLRRTAISGAGRPCHGRRRGPWRRRP